MRAQATPPEKAAACEALLAAQLRGKRSEVSAQGGRLRLKGLA